MNVVIADIETNGLLPALDRIHCVSTSGESGEPALWTGLGIDEGLKVMAQADRLVMANGEAFDVRAIQKVRPGWDYRGELWDTQVVSQTIYTDLDAADCRRGLGKLRGSHGLGPWGVRLGEEKGELGGGEDRFDHYTEAMGEYCRQDVRVTRKLYRHLLNQGWDPKILGLEHLVNREFVGYMERGVLMNRPALRRLAAYLQSEQARLDEEILALAGELLPPLAEFPEASWGRRKAFSGASGLLPCLPVHYITKKTQISKVKPEPFSPGSRVHCGRLLKEYCGWRPTKFGANGHPTLDEKTLETVDHPLAAVLAQRFGLQKRIGQVVTGPMAWLRRVESDGRIYHRIRHIGTITYRASHSGPNLGQVPRVGNPSGKECRQCFTVPDGYKMVGCDAKGLQMRLLAHYQMPYDGGRLAREILHEDTHTALQHRVAHVVPDGTRDQAKTLRYALLFGAFEKKLGSIYGGGAALGRKVKEAVMTDDVGLATLQEQLRKAAAQNGRLRSLDGRPLQARRDYSLLNSLLMSGEALVMKVVAVLTGRAFRREGLDAQPVLQGHDEIQAEVSEADAERAKFLMERAVVRAGRYWKLLIPLAGDGAIGNDWSETH